MIFDLTTNAYAMAPAQQGAGQAGGLQAMIMNLARWSLYSSSFISF